VAATAVFKLEREDHSLPDKERNFIGCRIACSPYFNIEGKHARIGCIEDIHVL